MRRSDPALVRAVASAGSSRVALIPQWKVPKSKMVQVQRAVEVASPPAPTVDVVKVEVVGKRFHRITLEWRLSHQPPPEWIEAFGRTVVDAEGFLWHVPSAYGQPMVMNDATIVWCMFEKDAQTAASFVDRAVAGTNSRCSLDPSGR
jgi:hypothetical protein